MKKFLLPLVLVLLAGCSTKTGLIPSDNFCEISQCKNFKIEKIIDESHYSSEEINLKSRMEIALIEAMNQEHILNNESQYSIITKITEYEPGNAFARWLVPGMGRTKLSTITILYNKKHEEIAAIPVSKMVGFGGAYTIGEWERVFKDVANLTAHKIADQTRH